MKFTVDAYKLKVFAVDTQAGVMYDHKLSPHHVDKSFVWT